MLADDILGRGCDDPQLPLVENEVTHVPEPRRANGATYKEVRYIL
jgi:hypothetical protein